MFAVVFVAVAAAWVRPAACAGSQAEAWFQEGENLYDKQDYRNAFPLLLKAASATPGLPKAQARVGEMYFRSKGVQENDAEAHRYFQLATAREYAYALSHFGMMYHGGYGVIKNTNTARGYAHRAADQGEMEGQEQVGTMYDDTGDKAQAMPWFEKAAYQGLDRAQYNLATLYINGQGGVARDFKLALYWSTLAYNQGEPTAVKYRSEDLLNCQDGVFSTCRRDAMALVNSFQIKSACAASGFTAASFCSNHGTPTPQDDSVQKICTCRCSAGYTGVRCETFPTKCPPGQSLSASMGCIACAPGQFKSGNTGVTACAAKNTGCSAGQRFSAGSDAEKTQDDTKCTSDCARGQYASAATNSICADKRLGCSAGRRFQAGSNTEQTRDDTQCTECTSGKYAPSTTATVCTPKLSGCSAGHGFTAGSNEEKTRDDAKCTACVAGQFKKGANINKMPCTSKKQTCKTGWVFVAGNGSVTTHDDTQCVPTTTTTQTATTTTVTASTTTTTRTRTSTTTTKTSTTTKPTTVAVTYATNTPVSPGSAGTNADIATTKQRSGNTPKLSPAAGTHGGKFATTLAQGRQPNPGSSTRGSATLEQAPVNGSTTAPAEAGTKDEDESGDTLIIIMVVVVVAVAGLVVGGVVWKKKKTRADTAADAPDNGMPYNRQVTQNPAYDPAGTLTRQRQAQNTSAISQPTTSSNGAISSQHQAPGRAEVVKLASNPMYEAGGPQPGQGRPGMPEYDDVDFDTSSALYAEAVSSTNPPATNTVSGQIVYAPGPAPSPATNTNTAAAAVGTDLYGNAAVKERKRTSRHEASSGAATRSGGGVSNMDAAKTCAYTSSSGRQCHTKLLGSSAQVCCNTHTCTSPQCTQPKPSKAEFCTQHSTNAAHYVSAEESRRMQPQLGGSALYEQQAAGAGGARVQHIAFVTSRGAHGTMATKAGGEAMYEGSGFHDPSQGPNPEYHDAAEFQAGAAFSHYVSAEESRRQKNGGGVLYEQQATGSGGGRVQPIAFVTSRGVHGTMATKAGGEAVYAGSALHDPSQVMNPEYHDAADCQASGQSLYEAALSGGLDPSYVPAEESSHTRNTGSLYEQALAGNMPITPAPVSRRQQRKGSVTSLGGFGDDADV